MKCVNYLVPKECLSCFKPDSTIQWNRSRENLTDSFLLCCSPIFAEIVPEKSRTSIFALDRFCESFSSSFASPLVGVLAQKLYGFNFTSIGTGNQVVDDQNAVSLAKAMYAIYTIPMVISFSIYASLYSTYPRDRDEALNTSKLKSYSPLTGPHLQLEVISSDSSALIMSSSDVADDSDAAFEVLQHTINHMSKCPT